jgi:hypothetical protein
MSETRITGIVSVFNKQNIPVSNYGKQEPDSDIGFESFEFWVPIRRPGGHNLAMKIEPPVSAFGKEQIQNGIYRPYLRPNAWIADLQDQEPILTIDWEQVQHIRKLVLSFDTDWDYAMESSLLGHTERIMPFVVRSYQIYDGDSNLLYTKRENHQTRNVIVFEQQTKTKQLKLVLQKPDVQVPVSLFGLSVYATD